MNKKNLLSPSYFSLIALLVMTCISCAHQQSNDSAALDGTDNADHSVWADTKDVGDAVANEEVAQEEKIAAPDMVAESVTGVTEQTTNEEQKKEDEAGMDAMLLAAESEEAAKPEVATPTMTVARIDSPKEDTTVIGDANLAQAPQDTFQANKDIYSTDKREPSSESNLEANSQTEVSNVPTIAAPAEVKETVTPAPRKHSGQRSSTQTVPHKKAEAKVDSKVEVKAPTNVPPTTTQDTQAKVSQPQVPAKVVAREMEESFGHEPIPGKESATDDEDEDAQNQLASVQIATFIEHHVVAVIIGIVGFIAGLYFFMRRNKENDSNSL